MFASLANIHDESQRRNFPYNLRRSVCDRYSEGASMRNFVMISIWLCVASMMVAAQEPKIIIPAEVAPFVEKGTAAIALEKGDLNGDGREAFILVLEKENPAKDKDDFPSDQRPLLILLRGADGKLALAKRNERVVMCSQ